MKHQEYENPTWAAIKTTLELASVEFTVRPIAIDETTLLVTAALAPRLALIINRYGDVDLQVASAVREEFTAAQLASFLAETLPQVLAAIKEGQIVDDVVLDREGRIRRASTRFNGAVPAGLRRNYELHIGRAARGQA